MPGFIDTTCRFACLTANCWRRGGAPTMRRVAAAAGIVLALSVSSFASPSVAHACYGPPSPQGGTYMYPGPPANGPCASWANSPNSPYPRQYMPPSVHVPPGYHYVLAPGGQYVLVPNQP